jgi:hypothetical protein
MDSKSENNHELPSLSKNVEIFEPSVDNNYENLVSNKELDKNASSTPNQQLIPLLQTSTATTSTTTVSTTQVDVPLNESDIKAEDVDIIEKEWVNKAKNTVNSTRNDPRRQNKEIAKLKKIYLKKRFNKTLIIDDNK